eukprot:1005322_1
MATKPTVVTRVLSAPPKAMTVIRVKSTPKGAVELEEAVEIHGMGQIVRKDSSSAEEGLKITQEGSQDNVAKKVKYHKKNTIGSTSDVNEAE